jgi:hypothetical protein
MTVSGRYRLFGGLHRKKMAKNVWIVTAYEQGGRSPRENRIGFRTALTRVLYGEANSRRRPLVETFGSYTAKRQLNQSNRSLANDLH